MAARLVDTVHGLGGDAAESSQCRERRSREFFRNKAELDQQEDDPSVPSDDPATPATSLLSTLPSIRNPHSLRRIRHASGVGEAGRRVGPAATA